MEDDLYNARNRMIGLNYLWLVDITPTSGMTLMKYIIYRAYQHTPTRERSKMDHACAVSYTLCNLVHNHIFHMCMCDH